jgi:hypothetical protein
MYRASISGLIVVFVLLFFSGCSELRPFRHQADRTDYAMTEQELKNLQFYLSTAALIKQDGVPMRIERGTPGLATEVGPNWLRVSFQKGNPGVYFLADPNDRIRGYYYVGVKSQESGGIQRLMDIPERKFVRDGVTYEVIIGPSAALLVSEGDVEKIVESRKLIQGQSKP